MGARAAPREGSLVKSEVAESMLRAESAGNTKITDEEQTVEGAKCSPCFLAHSCFAGNANALD